jgi:hypothetical protein
MKAMMQRRVLSKIKPTELLPTERHIDEVLR